MAAYKTSNRSVHFLFVKIVCILELMQFVKNCWKNDSFSPG